MTRLTWLLAVTGLASARGYDPEACLNSFTEVASNAIARRTVISKLRNYYVIFHDVIDYDVIIETLVNKVHFKFVCSSGVLVLMDF